MVLFSNLGGIGVAILIFVYINHPTDQYVRKVRSNGMRVGMDSQA